jgi:anti-sigma factor (TIGR02949 family)
MDCPEAREELSDLNRGRLPAGTAEAVRAHVEACSSCTEALRIDAELRTLIRSEAPRFAAPDALRARIRSLLVDAATGAPTPNRLAKWRSRLFAPRWIIGILAGAAAAVLVVWGGSIRMARDPVTILAADAVDEHREYMQETMTQPAADPSAVVRELKAKVDYPFEPIFPGDAQERLIAGKVSDLSGKRAVTFVYRDAAGRYTTLFLMPGAGIAIPTEGRIPIETFQPYHRVVSGHQFLLWKQGNLACALVSDVGEAGLSSVFLKIRKAL